MLWGAFLAFYIVLETENPNLSKWAGPLISTLCVACSYISAYSKGSFQVHFFRGVFGIIVYYLLWKGYKIYSQLDKDSEAREVFKLGAKFCFAGWVVWHFDNWFCQWEIFRRIIPFYIPLHGIWHLFAPFGLYCTTLLAIYNQLQAYGYQPGIRYDYNFLPYLINTKYHQK
jgi:hypothetical protein